MITLTQEQLINIINTSDVSFLLGAGCSISSGCMNATNLVYEFKKMMYCNDFKQDIKKFDFLSEELKSVLDNYFPDKDIKNPYSYYFERCLPLQKARMQFIKDQFVQKKPSTGYKCFAKILESKKTKFVYTTNFDDLIYKAIVQINPHCDVAKITDGYLPITTNDICITELHGDYNYNLPKNTEEELKALGENTKNAILNCPAQIIIVLGYSGVDNSVMDALKEFVKINRTKSVIWCSYDGKINENVKNFMQFANSLNEDSCICNFRGFDDLCYSYYKQYINNDENIDKELNKNNELNFSPSYKLNKKEILKSNLFKCEKLPEIYRIEKVDYSKELKDKINDKYIGQFHGGDLYFIGDIHWLKDQLELKNYEKFRLSEDFILKHFTISIKMLKDFVRKSILFTYKEIDTWNNKLYFIDNKDLDGIYEGFSIDFVNINDGVYISFLKEYIYKNEKSQAVKTKILNKFKKHRNDTSYEWLCDMVKIFDFKFDLFNTDLEYSNQSLRLSDLPYTLLPEPYITTDGNHVNVSALQCISQYGIKRPMFDKAKIKITIVCPVEDKLDLSQYFKNLNKIKTTNDKIYPDYGGFKNMFNIDLEYDTELFHKSDCVNLSFYGYCNFLLNKFEEIKRQKNPDLIVIYTPKTLEKFETNEDGTNNLHDFIKLNAANKYITQFISYRSIISSDALYKKMWNLAVALYTKTINLPWEPVLNTNSTAFIGVGYGVSKNGITVGCSQIFDSKGRGLQLLLKPISNKTKNPYMKEQEAYEIGQSLCNMYYNTYPTKPLENIVIHKSTPFKYEEIKGFEKAFSHLENIELIQIENKENIKAIKFFNEFAHNYPISRGTLIKINKNEALLWTHGSVKNYEINGGKPYVKGGKGYPSPILIRRFKGNLPLETIANDILMLTKMDYNSADVLYSNEPVTLKYTEKVVNIIKQGNNPLQEVDFRFII